ncbi:beta-1,6-N-acetylglucosaminyltransferase enzyme [Chlorella sorokiniana]|uniref:Beta-1,6-N-acetylglucosaminyltransferase enzyme n=1 Tax=Chlorella sorokiniana TaxID=3076 RepID=A0A2P6TBL2_CHLSO|nr:beta-1,6-N-acetylglucosaminyltransferase enzyme [Chlorella sorokiniana]|eukprot:PRW05935.1 beta-1,6-N-acetylglucosaminyltransferase enzyme [Chlorella sorokiniana]
MQRGRPMRNALLLLLSLILAANCVWAVQGLAAWRRGRGLRPVGSEQLMLQRLNATVLSVEDLVSQLKGMGSSLGSALAAAADGVLGSSGSSSSGEGNGTAAAEGGNVAANATANATAASPPPPPPPHRAVLRTPEVEEGSKDACAQALQMPKVALLFLTRGDLFHSGVWERWFAAARDLLPAEQLRTVACNISSATAASAPAAEPAAPEPQQRVTPEQLAAACGWDAADGQLLPSPGNAIDQQHLFSVYVHAPPNITDADLPELFRGRLITDRLLPQWGTHELVEATRNLLWEAYRDPLNQRFVLVSESDIPLYDPLTLYQQLVAEDKSRINVCRNAAPTDVRRWTWRMSGPALKSWHWRKSSQWFGMLRSHAQLVLEDSEVFRKFEEHCKDGWDGDYKRWRDCYSDEHYIPTLLATKGRDNESYCHIDGIVAVDWSAGGPHPKAYKSWEVRPSLITAARGKEEHCAAADAIADAPRRYVRKQRAFGGSSSVSGEPAAAEVPAMDTLAVGGDAAPVWQQQLCSSELAGGLPPYRMLKGSCSLTSRKFPKLTARAVARLFSDCRSGLHLLGPAACELAPAPAPAPQQAADGWQQEGAEQQAAGQPSEG